MSELTSDVLHRLGDVEEQASTNQADIAAITTDIRTLKVWMAEIRANSRQIKHGLWVGFGGAATAFVLYHLAVILRALGL